MTLCTDADQAGQPRWQPGTVAIHQQSRSDATSSVSLQHRDHPFTSLVARDDALTLRKVAAGYLLELLQSGGLQLPESWSDALQLKTLVQSEEPTAMPVKEEPVAWLPFESETEQAMPGFGSFRVDRRGADNELLDATVVLIACEWSASLDWLRSGLGLRVPIHLRPRPEGFEARFTGMSAALPPDGQPRFDLQRLETLKSSLPQITQAMTDSTGLRDVAVIGARVLTTSIRLIGTGRDERNGLLHQLAADAAVSPDGSAVELVRVLSAPLVADVSPPGTARRFAQNPASAKSWSTTVSRRPTRSEPALDALRKEQRIVPLAASPLADLHVQVMESDLVPGEDPKKTKAADLPGAGPDVRSDQFSAVNGYSNVCELFRRLALYGIPVGDCFRVAATPVKVRYRAGIRPGPGKDGNTINARVAVVGWTPTQIGSGPPRTPAKPAELEVHCALANLTHRARAPWTPPEPSRAKPLGIAADERWMWHEIGHLLIMAATGELEFRFAHSHGDALAAIACDPRSQSGPAARGMTFPWVFVPRRHDRCVHHGWSWSGTMHRPLADVPAHDHPRRKGYWSEQILSSTLFRLYRCLGGDTVLASGSPDIAARESASHLAVYLIIRATAHLPASLTVALHDLSDFIRAMRDADEATTVFSVPVSDGTTTKIVDRVGGCASKVVDWAFEAQGYNDPLPAQVSNSPGAPPAVDIYIASRRPARDPFSGDVDYGPGTYVPVSLDWRGTPAWHAGPTAIDVQGTRVRVTVANRGRNPASAVEVRVWWTAWPTTQAEAPLWDRTAWTACNLVSAQTVAADGGNAVFGPFTGLPASGRYIIFAEATCPGDRANTDPATVRSSSQRPVPLAEVVSCDNNLGLRVVDLP